MEARLEKSWAVLKGPPPHAVHMSSKLVDPEPVQNTQKFTCSSRHRWCGAGRITVTAVPGRQTL